MKEDPVEKAAEGTDIETLDPFHFRVREPCSGGYDAGFGTISYEQTEETVDGDAVYRKWAEDSDYT